MISLFCPFGANSTYRYFREPAFVNGHLFNGAVNDRLTVDQFTALSLAAHSCMSSLERARLLITMGLRLSKSVTRSLGAGILAE